MITKVSQSVQLEWDAYVDQHPKGSFCHLFAWHTVIVEHIGHVGHYLVSRDEKDNINGLLPLIEIKSRLFGHTLVSTPFCMYGGAIADDLSVQASLENHAIELAKQLNVDYLELRYQNEQTHLDEMSFAHVSAHSYFEKPIADDDEAILLSIKKKQRAVVRHSLKNELTTTINQDVDTLHHIYATSVRNLGTPVFPKKLFHALVKEFPEAVDILSVSDASEVQSSVMSFYYKDWVMPYYGGGLNSARASKSNDHMYYKLMCHARSKGKTVFDFGRSKNDSGAFKYKRTWGIEPAQLHHYFYLVKSSELPNLSPNNPKYRLLINTWKKLPLWLSKLIGPLLAKNLG